MIKVGFNLLLISKIVIVDLLVLITTFKVVVNAIAKSKWIADDALITAHSKQFHVSKTILKFTFQILLITPLIVIYVTLPVTCDCLRCVRAPIL